MAVHSGASGPVAEVTSPTRFGSGNGPTWPQYLEALQFLDTRWRDRGLANTVFGVFGAQPSWEDTIHRGQQLFELNSWANLDENSISLIAPAHFFADGDALLGSVGRRSNEVRRFLYADDAAQDRETILNLLIRARNLSATMLSVTGGDILADMCGVPGMGRSFATRLLALARPDGFVVVNNKSKSWLQQASNLSVGNNARSYNSLLKWLRRQSWYSAPEPVGDLARRAWRIRAALLDAFAYQPWQ